MSAEGFAATGLAEPLVAAAESLGCRAPAPLQAAAIPILRRGGNAILRGARGSGITLAWILAVLERAPGLTGAGSPRVLVLTLDTARAIALADATARIAAATEDAAWRALRIRAAAPGWNAAAADLLFLSTEQAAAAVAAAQLKLDAVGIVIIDDLTTQLTTGGGDAVELLLAALPAEAQRAFVASALDPAVDRLVDAHARRALHVPARPVSPARERAERGTLAYAVAPERDRLERLCTELGRRDAAEDVVLVRTDAAAQRLRDALARRGFGESAGGPAVTTFDSEDRATIAYHVPFAAADLDRLGGAQPLVVVAPAERTHLESIAAEAGLTLTPTGDEPVTRRSVGAYRERVARAIAEEDTGAHLALLAPLFEQHGAHEVAAALSALLRKKLPATPVQAAPPVPEQPSFVRLFISAGQRDGLRPADLVGAITGESGIAGDRVGRVDIRDTFSVVEVDAASAERVIRSLNGTTLRGRSVRVDYDRRSTPGAVRRSRAPRPGS